MDIKTCSMCNNEKQIKNFYKRFSECKDCNRTTGLKRYYENEVKKSIQKKYTMQKIEIK